MNKILLPFLVGTIAGCTVGPDYVRPQTPTPAQWSEGISSPGIPKDNKAWWKTFGDPVLTGLIAEAAITNLDLKQAVQRIRIARTQRTQAVAAGLPTLSAHSSVSRRLNSFSSPAGSTATFGSTSGTGAGGAFGIGDSLINIFQSGFDAQWELDLFGGIRRTVEAAEANTEAEVENRRALTVSLLGEVASQYITLRANQQLLAVVRDNLVTQRDTLHLTRERQKAGLSSYLDVAQAQAQVEATAAEQPLYENQVKLALHALSVLLDRPPGELTPRLQRSAPIPLPANLIAAELPSELLRRRPDILSAERRLKAANADIGAAVAAQYPRINLAAFIGLQNTDISDFTMLGKSWSMASTLAFPIFNWGSIQANIESKKARHQELVHAYRATVLNAFKEVEDALASLEQERRRLAQLQEAEAAVKLALDLAQERYLKGLTGFLDVLTAERSLLVRRQALIESQARIAGQRVALYKALGGGWEVAEPENRRQDG
ncbi:MAG: efflux transporter outer membrane subunit [Methylomicrobium sp.]